MGGGERDSPDSAQIATGSQSADRERFVSNIIIIILYCIYRINHPRDRNVFVVTRCICSIEYFFSEYNGGLKLRGLAFNL